MPLSRIDTVRLLRLSGTPEEMGAEHGSLMRSQIGAIMDGFLRKSQQIFEVPYPCLISSAKHCEQFIPQEYRIEMKALAEASGVSYEEVIAFNCLADIDATYTQALGQCSNVLVSTGENFFAHGRNFDFPIIPALHNATACVFARIPGEKEKHPTFSVGWPGQVGILTGCNNRGMSIGQVTAPGKGPTLEGVALSILIRQVLEQASDVASAYTLVRNSPRTHGYNLAVGNGQEMNAIAIECKPYCCEKRYMQDGYLVVDDLCMCRRLSIGQLAYSAGVLRHARAVSLLSTQARTADVNTIMAILRDTYDMSIALPRSPHFRGINTICNFMTAHSVVFLPRERRVLVSHRTVPAPLGKYYEVAFSDLW